MKYLAWMTVVVAGLSCLACNRSGGSSAASSSESQPTGPPAAFTKTPESQGDFGDADYGDPRTVTFTLKNIGGRPATLYVDKKSCVCAAVEIQPATIAPGAEGKVILTWVPKIDQEAGSGGRVLSSATLKARDADVEIKVEADGRIKPTLHVNLPRGQLDFGRFTLGQTKELPIEIYTLDPKHQAFTIEATSSTPGLLTSKLPLPADRLNEYKAVAGYRLTILTAVGLPVGTFREQLRLKTSVYPGRDLEVRVDGKVESGAVSINPEAANFPASIPTTGYQTVVQVAIRGGEPGRPLTLEVDKVDPPFLQVQVEPIKSTENKWRVRIRTPGAADLPKSISGPLLDEYLGDGFYSGLIMLKCNHSLCPQITIPVVPPRSGSQFKR